MYANACTVFISIVYMYTCTWSGYLPFLCRGVGGIEGDSDGDLILSYGRVKGVEGADGEVAREGSKTQKNYKIKLKHTCTTSTHVYAT